MTYELRLRSSPVTVLDSLYIECLILHICLCPCVLNILDVKTLSLSLTLLFLPTPPFLSLPSQNAQKSSMTGVPFLSLEGALKLNSEADPLQNEALVHMWMEVKIKPLLKSVTKHFLSCLSTKNFSCSSYQMMYV